MPLTATSTSVMSQDVIATANVLLDSTAARPVDIFLNPASGAPEAFGIVAATSASARMIGHVTRDAATDAGWSVNAVAGGIADAVEVAAGTVNGVTFGVYTDASTTWATQLQSDGTWAAPQSVNDTPLSRMRTTYTPDGRLVIYGADAFGNLVTLVQEVVGETLTAYTTSLNGALASGVEFSLVLTSHVAWSLVANVGGTPQMWTAEIAAGSAQPSTIQFANATLAHIVTGYWSDANQALMFFYTDANNQLYLWWSAAGTTSNIPFENSVVTASAAHVSLDRSIHLYTIDDQTNLSVLHQDKINPWNGDGSPNFVPFIGLDTNIGSVVCDTNPAAAPTLFAIDAGDQSLRLHTQDPHTNMWNCGPLLQSAVETYEVVRFRTEVTLVDENNVPVPNHPVTLKAAPNSSTSFVSCRGASYVVDAAGAAMTTDALGKLTFATLVNSKMVAPDVVFSADTLATPLTITPSAPVHEYLSGSATPLNPTNPGGPPPQFDAQGNALAGATTPDGQKVVKTQQTALLPVAASAIRQVAQTGLGKLSSDVVGFAFDLRGDTPCVRVFTSKDEFDAHVATMKPQELGSIWGSITHFAGDVYHAIEGGFLAIEQAAISVGDAVATFTTEVAKGITEAVSVAITSLEQAASIIAGVFRAILAEIEMIIEWLKALFDLRAIWNTKLAIDAAMSALPGIVATLVTKARTRTDNWFQSQEQAMAAALQSVSEQLGGSTFGGEAGLSSSGALPSIPGVSDVFSVLNDVHHNWLLDKLLSAVPGSPDTSAFSDALQNFTDGIGQDLADFLAGQLGSFGTWLGQTLSNPAALAQLGAGALLTAVGNILQGLLQVADAIADGVLDLAEAVANAVSNFLSAPLNLGFLTKLWDWITRHLTGGGGDFAVGTLISLVLAFPLTLIFKLINGVNTEPFPDGNLPGAAGAMDLGATAVPPGALLAAALAQMLYGAVSFIVVILEANAPWYLTALLAVAAGALWVFRNGTGGWVTESNASLFVLGVPLLLFILTSLWLAAPRDNNVKTSLLVTSTIYGTVLLLVGILQWPSSNKSERSANLLLPLASIASFLGLDEFQEIGGQEIQAFLAGVGFIGGGISEMAAEG